jgi:hypothetical protein
MLARLASDKPVHLAKIKLLILGAFETIASTASSVMSERSQMVEVSLPVRRRYGHLLGLVWLLIV